MYEVKVFLCEIQLKAEHLVLLKNNPFFPSSFRIIPHPQKKKKAEYSLNQQLQTFVSCHQDAGNKPSSSTRKTTPETFHQP